MHSFDDTNLWLAQSQEWLFTGCGMHLLMLADHGVRCVYTQVFSSWRRCCWSTIRSAAHRCGHGWLEVHTHACDAWVAHALVIAACWSRGLTASSARRVRQRLGMSGCDTYQLMFMQEVRALSLLDALATLTLAGNPLLERLGPRAVDVLVRNACPAVVRLDGRELSSGPRDARKAAAAAPPAEVHDCNFAKDAIETTRRIRFMRSCSQQPRMLYIVRLN